MDLTVYYDESYRANYLAPHAAALKSCLESRGFTILNAVELQSWMRQRIERENAHKSSLILCQDVVPDTVFPNGVDSANILLRGYLDNGGRVVWLGDIPLWYRAHEDPQDLDQCWQYGIPLAVLGIVPLFAESSSPCEWVDGLKDKMKSRWYSTRPVAIQARWYRRGLLATRNCQGLGITPLAYAQVTLQPSFYNMLMICRWRKAERKPTQVSAQAGAAGFSLGGGLSLTEAFPKELGVKKPLRLACAWHVRFNESYPSQGFYRFLDTQIDELSSQIVDDVELLAKLDKST